MDKIYRILGKRGRITIPYALRMLMGFHPNDLVSFTRNGDEVIVKREKICDNCGAPEQPEAATSTEALKEFLSSLPAEVQKDALMYLGNRNTPKTAIVNSITYVIPPPMTPPTTGMAFLKKPANTCFVIFTPNHLATERTIG